MRKRLIQMKKKIKPANVTELLKNALSKTEVLPKIKITSQLLSKDKGKKINIFYKGTRDACSQPCSHYPRDHCIGQFGSL